MLDVSRFLPSIERTQVYAETMRQVVSNETHNFIDRSLSGSGRLSWVRGLVTALVLVIELIGTSGCISGKEVETRAARHAKLLAAWRAERDSAPGAEPMVHPVASELAIAIAEDYVGRKFGALGKTESFASPTEYGWMVIVLPVPGAPDDHTAVKIRRDGTVIGLHRGV
jgi:hypothetical protein